MKSRVLFVLGIVLALTAFEARAQERILSFDSNVRIGETGALTVTETIEVEVEGRAIRHGILRDFPTEYRDRLGRKVTVPFDVVAVSRDGRPEPWTRYAHDNGVTLRIGSGGVLLPRGRHVYTIVYRTDFQLGFFDDHDELYWNATGNGWTFAIDSATAEVELPFVVPAAQLKAEGWTGYSGSKAQEFVAATRESGASWRTTRALRPREGLTIALSFPKGLIAPPSARRRLDRWLGDNRGEVAGAAGFALMLAFLFWRWNAAGRDPRKGPLFPRYEAPKGLGPAAVRYVDRMLCDNRCFAAGMLGLAQRGYLTIRETGLGYEISRTGKPVDWLPGEEAIAGMVPAAGSITVGRTYDPAVEAAAQAHQLLLKQFFGERLFSWNAGSSFAAFGIGAATVLAMYLLDAALPVVIVSAIVAAAVLAAMVKPLAAYTPEGRRAEDEVDGLRLYLGVAEGDSLARLKQPPRTGEEFARFLPYAVALGVEKTWADAFAKVLGASALAAATSNYYSAVSGGFSGPDHYVSSIAGLGSSISAAASPPGSSSGGGGGGSSGGGGGGGGGSGW